MNVIDESGVSRKCNILSNISIVKSSYLKSLEDPSSGKFFLYHSLFGNLHHVEPGCIEILNLFSIPVKVDEVLASQDEFEWAYSIIQEFCLLYYLVPEGFDERILTKQELVDRSKYLDRGELVNAIQLNVSEGCNLKCTYCFADRVDERSTLYNFGARNDQRFMSFETAVQSIKTLTELIRRNGNNALVIKFFGREPLYEDVLSDGRYKIERKLGEGGMGIVYKGRDRFLEIDVALKFQFPDAPPITKALFRREAIAMAKLAGHSNIASIFYVGHCLIKTSYGNEPANYIAFEYLPGGTAEQLVKPNKSLEEIIKCLKVGVAVCDGLGYAHDHSDKILHRDIKPSNILLGENEMVKVSDFGLAKPLTEPSGMHTGKFFGTPPYMAPEQFDPDHTPNIKIDIWQLGATFYQLLTGELPFPEILKEDFPRGRKNPPSESPKQKNQNIPPGVSDCIMGMLIPNPELRIRDCREVRDRLERELNKLDSNRRIILQQDIRQSLQLKNIRHALKKQVEIGIEKLVSSAEP